jgi:glycosyltransferase involved in cell wall biosynthesis
MCKQKTASVIVVNYNYAKFVAAAIDSALAQSWLDVEVIVVDDGSTDDSRQIIASYGDRIIPLLKSNGGQASAVNAGFAAAQGDAFILLDADDVLLPDAVSEAMRCFEDPRVIHVHWPMWEIDAAGNNSGTIIPRHSLQHGDLRQDMIEHGPDVFVSPPCSGNAWSRDFAAKVMPMPSEGTFGRHAEMYLVTLSPIFGTVCAVSSPHSC